MAAVQQLFGFMNFLFEKFRVDGAFVDIEQRHVVVGDLVKLNNEFDQIRVSLLPEWFLSFAEQIVEQ